MPAASSPVHRIAVWGSAGVLALSIYVASWPLVFESSQRSGWGRFLVPVVQIVYSPLRSWVEAPGIGAVAYLEYANWVLYHLNEPEVGNAESYAKLGWPVTADFHSSRLSDVVTFFGEMVRRPIELDPAVDGDIEVTLQFTGPLRDVLQPILAPHGLIAWPADGRIAIGTPAAIERVRASDRANHPFPAGGYVLMGLIGASTISLTILLRRRRPSGEKSPGSPSLH